MDGGGYFVLAPLAGSRVCLVGTVVKIVECRYLDGGRMSVQIEGGSRYFLKEVLPQQKSHQYIKAKVHTFQDYTMELPAALDQLEQDVFRMLKINLQVIVGNNLSNIS